MCQITEKKKWEHKRQYVSHLQTSRKLMIQLGERFVIIFSLSLVHPSNYWVNKMQTDRNLSDKFPINDGLKQETVYI